MWVDATMLASQAGRTAALESRILELEVGGSLCWPTTQIMNFASKILSKSAQMQIAGSLAYLASATEGVTGSLESPQGDEKWGHCMSSARAGLEEPFGVPSGRWEVRSEWRTMATRSQSCLHFGVSRGRPNLLRGKLVQRHQRPHQRQRRWQQCPRQ
jgi:hypothetical protein